MTYQIDDNIPLPTPRKPYQKGFADTLRALGIGQSFFIPGIKSRSVAGSMHLVAKELGRRFTTRKEGDGVRIWRVE